MIKNKHLGLIAIASTTLLFSGCVQQPDTFYNNQNGYYNSAPRVNVALVSYPYPYYYDRPFYFFNGIYYYGGYYRDGFYHYGHRRFRHGHYYHRGNRYYNGRRYVARSGQYGYYKNRGQYQRLHNHRKYKKIKKKHLDRGREYHSRSHKDKKVRRSHIGNDRGTLRDRDRYTTARSTTRSQSTVRGSTRQRSRPVR